MFGQNDNTNNPGNNNQSVGQGKGGVSIGGYTSPYLSTESTVSKPQAANLNPEADLSLAKTPSNLAPVQKQFNAENITSNSQPSQPDSQVSYNPTQKEESPETVLDLNNNQNFESNILNTFEPEEVKEQIPTVNNLAPNLSQTQNIIPQQKGLDPFTDLNLKPSNNLETNQVNSDEEVNVRFLLDTVIQRNASDLHLTVGYSPMIRIDGKLETIGRILTSEDVQKLINETLSGNQKELLEVNKEVDLSYSHEGKGRFRVNAYNERGNLAAAYRLIPTKIKSVEELNLPKSLYDFTQMSQGLFLVTGPTGSGKSTTLAGMIQEINANEFKHIITIEDPIEYVYPKLKALVDQRELGEDTHDWGIALRSILRQDPDVVLIGEMRDFETIQAAITTAETGHLVFATLHTNSAAQSIDRIIDVFPPHQQEQIRTQLAGALKGILSQRLVPKIGGGREAATELMVVTPAIQNLIREGKTYQIDNIISTSFDIGMMTLERSLVRMVREGKITLETAQEYAIRPEDVLKIMKSGI